MVVVGGEPGAIETRRCAAQRVAHLVVPDRLGIVTQVVIALAETEMNGDALERNEVSLRDAYGHALKQWPVGFGDPPRSRQVLERIRKFADGPDQMAFGLLEFTLLQQQSSKLNVRPSAVGSRRDSPT